MQSVSNECLLEKLHYTSLGKTINTTARPKLSEGEYNGYEMMSLLNQ
jgi:hypothetical protein